MKKIFFIVIGLLFVLNIGCGMYGIKYDQKLKNIEFKITENYFFDIDKDNRKIHYAEISTSVFDKDQLIEVAYWYNITDDKVDGLRYYYYGNHMKDKRLWWIH